MISCMDTIYAYNEFFLFLQERHGREAVEEFFEYVADISFQDARREIPGKGIDAVYKYLYNAWTGEGDVLDFECDETSVTITVHNCSSIRKLRKAKHIKRYHNYCGHCAPMYTKLFDELGFDFEIVNTNPELGMCRIKVSEKQEG